MRGHRDVIDEFPIAFLARLSAIVITDQLCFRSEMLKEPMGVEGGDWSDIGTEEDEMDDDLEDEEEDKEVEEPPPKIAKKSPEKVGDKLPAKTGCKNAEPEEPKLKSGKGSSFGGFTAPAKKDKGHGKKK